MLGIDTWLEGLLHSVPTLGFVLLISLALGLRHASDPDHLAAVTTLIATEGTQVRRTAMLLGLSWGLGHATTLILLGLPLVLFKRYLPELVQQGAEVAIGILIVLIAVRLLYRWSHGHYHAHLHCHSDHTLHHHLHAHADGTAHDHTHMSLPRTPLAAYGIGLIHGVGGSAGLTLLLLSTIPGRVEAAAALLLFAAGTALSMTALSAGLGWLIARGPVARRVDWVMPMLGGLSVAFGVYYALGALGIVNYPL
jgi:ABC-type nickel/cobalt efflux system permease component RcnA